MDNSVSKVDNIVSIRNLTFSRDERKIFDNISLEIPRNKITAIMGPSGTGKNNLAKAYRRTDRAGFRNRFR